MVNPENVLQKLFSGVAGNAITRDEILRKITVKTFSNYSSILQSAGLVTAQKKDPKDNRIITRLKLTQKGQEVIGAAKDSESNTNVGGRNPVISGKLDLEEITKLTDEFTRRNPSWEWRLVRKEEVASQR